MITGNKSFENDILVTLLNLEKKTMKDLNVAEVVRVLEISNETFKCQSLNDNSYIECYKLTEVSVEIDDIALVLFTNTNFKANLRRYKNGENLQPIEEKNYHSKNYGIIVGTLYKGEE